MLMRILHQMTDVRRSSKPGPFKTKADMHPLPELYSNYLGRASFPSPQGDHAHKLDSFDLLTDLFQALVYRTTLPQPFLISAMVKFVEHDEDQEAKNTSYGLIAAFALDHALLAMVYPKRCPIRNKSPQLPYCTNLPQNSQ